MSMLLRLERRAALMLSLFRAWNARRFSRFFSCQQCAQPRDTYLFRRLSQYHAVVASVFTTPHGQRFVLFDRVLVNVDSFCAFRPVALWTGACPAEFASRGHSRGRLSHSARPRATRCAPRDRDTSRVTRPDPTQRPFDLDRPRDRARSFVRGSGPSSVTV